MPLYKSTNFTIPDNPNYKTQWNPLLDGLVMTIPNGEIFYSEDFFNKTISDSFVHYLQENNTYDIETTQWKSLSLDELEKVKFTNVNWQQDNIKMFGKTMPLPRLTSWYGDAGAVYTYSGIRSEPNVWSDGLLTIKNEIETRTKGRYNSVLLNWYRDGEDHMGWHCDDERELGVNPTIASANFGASRDFLIRRKDDKTQKLSFELKHGSLLIMRGELQHYWEHSVPKRKRVLGSRFNLTFRNIENVG